MPSGPSSEHTLCSWCEGDALRGFKPTKADIRARVIALTVSQHGTRHEDATVCMLASMGCESVDHQRRMLEELDDARDTHELAAAIQTSGDTFGMFEDAHATLEDSRMFDGASANDELRRSLERLQQSVTAASPRARTGRMNVRRDILRARVDALRMHLSVVTEELVLHDFLRTDSPAAQHLRACGRDDEGWVRNKIKQMRLVL